MRPRLQLALDIPDLASAVAAADAVRDHIDIIEAGTVLCVAEGLHAVRALRAGFPRHEILADLRIVRAGDVLAGLAFEAGASAVTVMSDAPEATLLAAVEQATGHGGAVCVELTNGWSMAHARRWAEVGVGHVIFHRSHEAHDTFTSRWEPADLAVIGELAALGLAPSVTGGLTPADVQQFDGVPVDTFIAGRAISGAVDPAAAAAEFQKALEAISQ